MLQSSKYEVWKDAHAATFPVSTELTSQWLGIVAHMHLTEIFLIAEYYYTIILTERISFSFMNNIAFYKILKEIFILYKIEGIIA